MQVPALLALALTSLVVLRAAEWLAVMAVGVAGLLAMTALTNARGLPAMVGGWASWSSPGCAGCPCSDAPSMPCPRCRSCGRSCAPWRSPSWRSSCSGACSPQVTRSSDRGPRRSCPSSRSTASSSGSSSVRRRGTVLRGLVRRHQPTSRRPAGTARGASRGPGLGVARAGRARHCHSSSMFVVAQATATWGGHDYVQQTTGLSYADYVHQGFGQLTAATFLTLLTVALAVRKAPRETAQERLLLRIALGPLCAGARGRRLGPLPDARVPAGLRLHRAACPRRCLRAVDGAAPRPRPGRRRPDVRALAAPRRAPVGRALRPRHRPGQPRGLGRAAATSTATTRPASSTSPTWPRSARTLPPTIAPACPRTSRPASSALRASRRRMMPSAGTSGAPAPATSDRDPLPGFDQATCSTALHQGIGD